MATVADRVKAMAWESAQRQTPTVLRHFLEATFADSAQSGLCRRMSPAERYEVTEIQLFDDEGCFRRSCFFFVCVGGYFLEAPILSNGGTFGLFALLDDGPRYLNHRQEELEHVLRVESRPLSEYPPTVLASLVVEAIGRDGSESHDVLTSAEHLASYRSQVGGYEISRGEWERVNESVTGPTITGDITRGWLLEFCSLFGWMHEKQYLIRHRCRFGPDFRITRDEQILSQKIFKQTPGVRY